MSRCEEFLRDEGYAIGRPVGAARQPAGAGVLREGRMVVQRPGIGLRADTIHLAARYPRCSTRCACNSSSAAIRSIPLRGIAAELDDVSRDLHDRRTRRERDSGGLHRTSAPHVQRARDVRGLVHRRPARQPWTQSPCISSLPRRRPGQVRDVLRARTAPGPERARSGSSRLLRQWPSCTTRSTIGRASATTRRTGNRPCRSGGRTARCGTNSTTRTARGCPDGVR